MGSRDSGCLMMDVGFNLSYLCFKFIKMADGKNHLTDDKTVTLHTFPDLFTAQAMQARLEQNGIKSFLRDENVMGVDPIAGVELKVFEKDAEKAAEFIKD